MIRLPFPPTDVNRLCDWLELQALHFNGRSFSVGDIGRAITSGGYTESRNSSVLDDKLAEVVRELGLRKNSAAGGYPFIIDGDIITFYGDVSSYVAYTFCLCISYLGSIDSSSVNHQPRKLFEHVSCQAVSNYLPGKAVRFGWPRDTLPSGFAPAISKVCELLREGEGYNERPIMDKKDDHVDVIAWRDFPDGQSGKLVIFGNCASGEDWDTKTRDTLPNKFCENWMRQSPYSQLLTAFFVPHRIDLNAWDYTCRHAGMVFDRCRIAYYLQNGRSFDRARYDRCQRWTMAALGILNQ